MDGRISPNQVGRGMGSENFVLSSKNCRNFRFKVGLPAAERPPEISFQTPSDARIFVPKAQGNRITFGKHKYLCSGIAAVYRSKNFVPSPDHISQFYAHRISFQPSKGAQFRDLCSGVAAICLSQNFVLAIGQLCSRDLPLLEVRFSHRAHISTLILRCIAAICRSQNFVFRFGHRAAMQPRFTAGRISFQPSSKHFDICAAPQP